MRTGTAAELGCRREGRRSRVGPSSRGSSGFAGEGSVAEALGCDRDQHSSGFDGLLVSRLVRAARINAASAGVSEGVRLDREQSRGRRSGGGRSAAGELGKRRSVRTRSAEGYYGLLEDATRWARGHEICGSGASARQH